jgi:hypothetical protein
MRISTFRVLGEPERLQGRLVSAGFLTTLGIKPLYGRDFLAEDDRPGVTPTVILSYGLWSRLFANDPNIVGRQITLNNQSYTVVAVTPPEFRFGLVGLDADVSVPIGPVCRTLQSTRSGSGNRRSSAFEAWYVTAASRNSTELSLRTSRTTVSRQQRTKACVSNAAPRILRRQCSNSSADFARLSRAGVVDRLRKRGEPFARSSFGAARERSRFAWRSVLVEGASFGNF